MDSTIRDIAIVLTKSMWLKYIWYRCSCWEKCKIKVCNWLSPWVVDILPMHQWVKTWCKNCWVNESTNRAIRKSIKNTKLIYLHVIVKMSDTNQTPTPLQKPQEPTKQEPTKQEPTQGGDFTTKIVKK